MKPDQIRRSTIVSTSQLYEQLNITQPASGTDGVLATLGLWISRASERRRYRRELPRMADSELRDLGLDRKAASEIANTPFWRA